MKKDAYYFSHDYNSRNDEKIVELRYTHGWEGYGVWWAIVEMLYEASEHRLKNDCNRIAFALQVDCTLAQSVIEDFDLFELDDDGNFYSVSVDRRDAERKKISDKRRKAARKRWDNASALQDGCKSNAVKERKGKEKKRNNSNARPREGASDDKKNEMPQGVITWNWKSDSEFMSICEPYPKKTALQRAYAVFCEVRATIDVTEVRGAIVGQSEAGQIDKSRYTPDLANWLRDGRWNDDIVENDEPGTQNSAAKLASEKSWQKVHAIVCGRSTRDKTPLSDYEKNVLKKTKQISAMKTESERNLPFSAQAYKARFIEDYEQ